MFFEDETTNKELIDFHIDEVDTIEELQLLITVGKTTSICSTRWFNPEDFEYFRDKKAERDGWIRINHEI